ncbi:MAG: DHA2 family efflux MFS transporter permease subunit [Coriobacteriales bacterium]|nr:DHA2 family efflux MFS transporter permease subunit [Coriobacteriales bacterium]
MDVVADKNINVRALLAVLFAAAFIAAFNENIVNVGLVDIMSEFAIDAPTAQWLVTGYMIVTTIVVSIVAWLQKRFGLRSLFVAASVLLLVGSIACLFAPSFPLLLTFRLLQAVGTGIFVPVMMTTVLALAPRPKLGSYLAIGSACITLGPALGPVVSGVVVTCFGWRAMFWPPIIAMTLIACAGFFFVRTLGPGQRSALDVLSVTSSTVGLTLLVYGLLQLSSRPLMALALIATAAVLIAFFALRQRGGANPILDLTPLEQPRFLIACVLVIVCMMTTFSLSVLLPLYFEQALGSNALVAGLLLLAPILVNAATALLGGRILDSRGERPLLPVGYALMAVGLVLLTLLAPRMNMLAMVLAAAVAYASVGLVMSPTQTSGLSGIPHQQHASGVALMNTFIQLAASVGPSLFVGILSSTAAREAAAGATETTGAAAGFAAATLIAACIAAAGFVASLFYVRSRAQDQRSANVVAPTLSPLRSLMKTDVYTVHGSDSVSTALKILVDKGISGMPVLDASDRVMGFISDGDIMRHLADVSPVFKNAYSFIAERDDLDFQRTLDDLMHIPVANICTKGAISVDVNASLGEVCRVLANGHLKKAPVMENGRMVGIINRSNITRYCITSYLERA